MSHNILVNVHPGSACGSANSNIGRSDARSARQSLVEVLDGWTGGLLVIDGEFSDELPDYPAFEQAIDRALERALGQGLISRRVLGDDPDQRDRICEFVADLPQGAKPSFTVTGAWYHPEDGGGCVGSVIQELQRLGQQVQLCSSAVCIELSIEGDEDRDEENTTAQPNTELQR